MNNEHIYHTIKVSNFEKYTNSNKSIPAQIYESTPKLIKRQSDYKMSVTNFSMLFQLPIMVCPIVENLANTDPDATIFGVCLSYVGNDYPTRISYINDNGTPSPAVLPPSANNGTQDLRGFYYNIYYFETFIKMVNNALLASYTAFNAAHGGVHASAPYYIYNPDSGLFSLISEFSYSLIGACTIHHNQQLNRLFDNIRIFFNGFDQANFKDYTLLIENRNNTNAYALKGATIPVPPLNPAYLQMEQEFDSRYSFTNIKSVLITTTINIRQEVVPQEEIINAFTPPSRGVLTYFDINYTTEGGWRQPIFYVPKIYKWIDLLSTDDLNSFAVGAEIILFSGKVLPLNVPINSCASIKLLFEKK